MNFNNGPPYNNPAYNTQFGAYASVFPGMVPPMTVAPGMPGAVAPAMPVAYPPGQGPLADKPAQRGANGLFEAPEMDGPERHEAMQYIKLNPGEEVKYGEYWSQAVGEEDKVGGKEAVAFLGRAKKVSKGQLRRIWDIADHNKEGFLGRDEFYVALRLVALAQRGAELSVHGLRNFTGIQLIPDIAPEEKKEEPQEELKKPDGFSWTVSKEDVAKYDALFKKLDEKNVGMIDGKQGVAFFGKSGFPRPTLKKIWGLADVTQDGKLSLDEFRIAMHIVTNMLNKKITVTGLPSVMDPSGPNWLRIEGEEDLSTPPESRGSPAVISASGAIAMPPAPAAQPHSLDATSILAPPTPPQVHAVPHSPLQQSQPIQMQKPSPLQQPLAQTHRSPSQQDEAERMREALQKERLEVELQKERLEVERARREMEEMRAEMERLRVEKESLVTATAQISASTGSQPPIQAPAPPGPAYLPSLSRASVPSSGPAVTQGFEANVVEPTPAPSAPVSKPLALDGSGLADTGAPVLTSASKGGVVGPDHSNSKDDDDDIWDQPSPKASALAGPGATATKGNVPMGSKDSVSSDDDDFWGGLGAKPTLGPAGGQKPGESKGGFGGSELDDWVF
eukprot:GFKZ01006442.1.p1 GENE.GFKZ01006442.1~~GFKZ01006442.1.p1  ORF type:complete len:619 (+),score=98.44 GFKZ01006442.1:169-2025(+)